MSVKFGETILPPPGFDTGVQESDAIQDAAEFNGEGVEFQEFDIETETRNSRVSSARSYMYGDKSPCKEKVVIEPKLVEDSEPFEAEDQIHSEPQTAPDDEADFSNQDSIMESIDTEEDDRSAVILRDLTLEEAPDADPAICNGNSRGPGPAPASGSGTDRTNGSVFMNKTEKLIADEIRDYKRRENELKKIRANLNSTHLQDCALTSSNQTPSNKSFLPGETNLPTTSSKQADSEEYSHVEMLSRKFSAFSNASQKSISPNFTCTNGLIHEATLRRSKNLNRNGSPLINSDSSSTSTGSNGSELSTKLFGTSESSSSFSSSLHSIEDDDQHSETKSTRSDFSNQSNSEIASCLSPHTPQTSSSHFQKAPQATSRRAPSKVPEFSPNKFSTDSRPTMKGVMERFIASKGKELPTFVKSINHNEKKNGEFLDRTNIPEKAGTISNTVSVVEESKRKFNCGEFGDKRISEKKSVEEKIREELISMQRREEELRYNRWRTSSHSDLLSSNQNTDCLMQSEKESSPDTAFSLYRTSSIPNLINAE